MSNSEVYWHEGMFLRQHHFLAEHRQLLRQVHVGGKWSLNHNWGLRSIRLSEDALGNFRFAVGALRARLRDGTLIEVPEDGPLPEVDLKPVLQAHRKVTIYLGVPVLQSGHPNTSEGGPVEGLRYYVETRPREDENLGTNPQPITLRRLNFTLLLSTQNLAGYEAVPIARVEKSERAEATPQLDPGFFPPVLACDAWRELQVGVLQSIYDRIGRKIEKLAGQAVSRGLNLDSLSPVDNLIFSHLRVLNESYAVLTNLAFLEGVHPLTAYLELSRLVGQLSVFGASRRTPAILRYDHDDLAGCFYRLKNDLDDLLAIVPEPDYQERPFVGHGLRMQVALERDWLDRKAPMYIGVRSPMEPDACAELLSGQLDMKVGSSERVDHIYRSGGGGLRFAHVPASGLPQALPRPQGLTFFQVLGLGQAAYLDDPQPEWQHVERSLSLAIRFNDTMIVGSIDRQEVVTLRLKDGELPFRFTLFVLPVASARPGAPA